MSRKSETALREELAKLAVENREPREMVSRLETASSGRVAAPETENDQLRLEIAERNRRMAKYENPHTHPRPALQREARRLPEDDGGGRLWQRDGDGGGPEPDGDGDSGKVGDEPSRKGPSAGHLGASKNKADRTVARRVYWCTRAGAATSGSCRRSSRWPMILPAVTT